MKRSKAIVIVREFIISNKYIMDSQKLSENLLDVLEQEIGMLPPLIPSTDYMDDWEFPEVCNSWEPEDN